MKIFIKRHPVLSYYLLVFAISWGDILILIGGHGQYIGEITTITPEFKESDLVVPMIEKFLDKKPGKK